MNKFSSLWAQKHNLKIFFSNTYYNNFLIMTQKIFFKIVFSNKETLNILRSDRGLKKLFQTFKMV